MSLHDNLLNLDFNALRTLRQVYRHGSFSKAADTIGVKQSTVSYTIDRLRNALDDQLFVRQGGRNVPTSRCNELIPIVESVLAHAERMEFQGEFDPSQTEAEVSIVCSTFSLQVILPQVFARLRKEAPNISVSFTQRFEGISDLLLEGKADLALLFENIEGNGIYAQERLYTDVAVCVMDPDNPLAGKRLTKQQLGEAVHIRAQFWANWKQPYVSAAEKLGIKIETRLTVADQMNLMTYIRGTDLVGGMPSKMALSFGDQIGIAYFPFNVTPHLNMYWSAASNQSPLNCWLRQLINEEVDKIGPPMGI